MVCAFVNCCALPTSAELKTLCKSSEIYVKGGDGLMSVDPKTRRLIYLRCGGYCEKCGWPLSESWAAHHRQLRSQGGADDASNLLAVCHGCHNGNTDSIHLNPDFSYELGYLVRSWDHPKKAAVRLPDGTKKWLDDEGHYLPAPPEYPSQCGDCPGWHETEAEAKACMRYWKIKHDVEHDYGHDGGDEE